MKLTFGFKRYYCVCLEACRLSRLFTDLQKAQIKIQIRVYYYLLMRLICLYMSHSLNNKLYEEELRKKFI
jgi:hypothetical protein